MSYFDIGGINDTLEQYYLQNAHIIVSLAVAVSFISYYSLAGWLQWTYYIKRRDKVRSTFKSRITRKVQFPGKQLFIEAFLFVKSRKPVFLPYVEDAESEDDGYQAELLVVNRLICISKLLPSNMTACHFHNYMHLKYTD